MKTWTTKIKISNEERFLLSNFYGEDMGNKIDFNKLMAIMQKIKIKCTQEDALVINMPISSSLGKIYNEVVEFIKWYNDETSTDF